MNKRSKKNNTYENHTRWEIKAPHSVPPTLGKRYFEIIYSFEKSKTEEY